MNPKTITPSCFRLSIQHQAAPPSLSPLLPTPPPPTFSPPAGDQEAAEHPAGSQVAGSEKDAGRTCPLELSVKEGAPVYSFFSVPLWLRVRSAFCLDVPVRVVCCVLRAACSSLRVVWCLLMLRAACHVEVMGAGQEGAKYGLTGLRAYFWAPPPLPPPPAPMKNSNPNLWGGPSARSPRDPSDVGGEVHAQRPRGGRS